MSGKISALLWNFIHSAADLMEEKILSEHDEAKYFFFQNLFLFSFTFLLSLFFDIQLTFISAIVIILYAFSFIGGDFCYAKSISHVPIGLANLICSGDLFLILLCDIFLGYVSPNPIFLILFLLFFISVVVFSNETNKMKDKIKKKKIDMQYVMVLVIATIFYSAEPYFIKLASSKGANEWGINVLSIAVATCWWGIVYFRKRKKIMKEQKTWVYLPVLGVGFLYALAGILYTSAYMDETPIIISLILQIQTFLVVIISVIQKTDKMNFKKTISLLVSIFSLVLMTFFY